MKPYSVNRTSEHKPYSIDHAVNTIRPMNAEERRASLQRAQVNHRKEDADASEAC